MTDHVVRSKKADKDIQKITQWSMENFGEKQIRQYLQGMLRAFQGLVDTPKRGRPYLNYFYFRYESHVIYYRLRKNDIFIARILHMRMLPEKHIK